MKAIIGMGANLGEREAALKEALSALGRLPRTFTQAVSSFYATEPVGVDGYQPDYINCVALLETELPPEVLMGALLGIESASGRLRPKDIEKAPRVLDLDLLLYGDEEKCTFREDFWATLPHPRMWERAFVLVPLAELYPEKKVMGIDFSADLQKVSGQRIMRLTPER